MSHPDVIQAIDMVCVVTPRHLILRDNRSLLRRDGPTYVRFAEFAMVILLAGLAAFVATRWGFCLALSVFMLGTSAVVALTIGIDLLALRGARERLLPREQITMVTASLPNLSYPGGTFTVHCKVGTEIREFLIPLHGIGLRGDPYGHAASIFAREGWLVDQCAGCRYQLLPGQSACPECGQARFTRRT